MERHSKLIAQQILDFSVLLIVFILGAIRPATAQVDFPIGYVSRGGTYAFISLIEQHKLWNRRASSRPSSTSAGRRSRKH